MLLPVHALPILSDMTSQPAAERGQRRSRFTPRGLLVGGALLATTIGLVAAAPPANAGICTNKTGGSSNALMWTGSTYTCAYVAASGNKSIGMWDTQTWTSSTALGYSRAFDCDGQSGGVSISQIYTDSAGTNIGSSLTYTAFNGSSGSRHWNAAALWQTASGGSVADDQYVANCGDNYSIATNTSYISALTMTGPTSVATGSAAHFTATVTAPDGGASPTGTVALFKQATPGVSNPPTKDCADQSTNSSPNQDTPIAEATLSNGVATLSTPLLPSGSYSLYAVYLGSPMTSQNLPAYCMAPPQFGLTPAIQTGQSPLTVGSSGSSSSLSIASSTAHTAVSTAGRVSTRGDTRAKRNPRLKVVNRVFTTPATVSVKCPAGRKATQVTASSPDLVVPSATLRAKENGEFHISKADVPVGTRINVQLLCRPKSAEAMFVGKRIAYGSAHADNFTTRKAGSVLFAGYGADSMSVKHRKAVAEGGPGKDRIVLASPNSAGNGGPGNDWIKASSTGKVLLIGGNGSDTLIGGRGRTLINAIDGKPDDTIICRKPNIVLADQGDQIRGNCKVIDLPR